jgi:glycosyltransferase involved in cell wall biosynthesis
MNRRKVLLVAYQCGPGMGSVSQIGWEWYSRLSQTHAVTLVTHVRNRQALEGAGAPLNDSELIFIDTEWFAGPLYRLAKRIFPRSEHSVFLVSSLDYFVFDAAAYRRIRSALASGKTWDVIHRVTPVTLAAPTWLVHLGIPVIIGPLNSGLKDPRGFGKVMRQESTWLVRLREFGRLFDGIMGSTRGAARLLIASCSTQEAVSPRYHARCLAMIENGVELTRFVATDWPAPPNAGNPLRVLFVGRLIPVKALDLLLNAVADLLKNGHAVQLTVIGDGPMREDWERHAHTLELGSAVSFVGNQSLAEVAAAMQRCHVFCLPSVRESGGAVLLEAMACARPVIGMNFGGPAEVVDDTVGALVELTNPEQASADIASLLQQVIAQPQVWARRGQAGRLRVEQRYSWDAKIKAAAELYAQVASEGKQ